MNINGNTRVVAREMKRYERFKVANSRGEMERYRVDRFKFWKSYPILWKYG